MAKRKCADCLTMMAPQAIEVVKVRGQERVQCRSNLQCLNRAAAKLRGAYRIGAQMANACYNLSQKAPLCERDRNRLAELAALWDTERRG